MASEKQNGKMSKKSSLLHLLKLILVVISAFLAGLCFRPSVGILAMTPLFLVFCGISAFIGIDAKIKYICFGVTVFWLNTVEQADKTPVLIFAALCLLACIAFEYAVKYIRKNKKIGISVFSVSALVCILLSFIFVGNPISAITAKNEIEGYAASIYPESDEYFGSFEFSDIYYNFKTKTYIEDAKSSKFPTEGATLSYKDGVVRDGFKSIVEVKAAEPFVLEFTEVLRHSFPSDGFSVDFERFVFLPNQNLFSAGDDGLYGNIDFEINLYGIQSVPEFFDRVDRYYEAISESGINYSSVVFRTGTSANNGIWFSRSVTLNGSFRKEFAEYKFELIPTGTSKLFNKYFASFTSMQ